VFHFRSICFLLLHDCVDRSEEVPRLPEVHVGIAGTFDVYVSSLKECSKKEQLASGVQSKRGTGDTFTC